MPEISQKKLKIIKRRYGEQSVEEIARDLSLSPADVREAIKSLGIDRTVEVSDSEPLDLKKAAFVAAILLILTAVCFGRTLDYPLVFDDHHTIQENRFIRDLSHIGGYFTDPNMFSNEPERRMYRPLILLSYAVNYAISPKTANWRVVNIIFHAINAFVVFLILLRLLKNFEISAALAAVFAAHPVVTETVVYLSSRSTLFAATFVLSAFYSYLRLRTSLNKTPWIAACSVFFALALMCKENALMLPVALVAVEVLLSDKLADIFTKDRLIAFVPLIVIAVLYLLMRKTLLDLDTVVVKRHDRSIQTQIFTQMGVWLAYIWKMLFPVGLNAQGAMTESTQFMPKGASIFQTPAICAFIWIVLGAAAIFGRKNRNLTLGLSFMAIILIPETVTALNQIYTERRMYMPLFGALLAVGGIISASDLAKSKRAAIAIALVALMMIPLAVNRAGDWRSEKALWIDSIKKSPLSAESWHGLGYVYGQENKYYKSMWALDHTLRYNPRFAASLRLMGGLLLTVKKPKEALPYLERSVKIESLAPRGWYNLGLAQAQLDMMDEAIASYEKAISISPHYAPPHNNLGGLYLRKGRLAEAQREFELAVKYDPENKEYASNLEKFMQRLPKLKEMFGQQ